MTKEEFKKRMKAINDDPELYERTRHEKADALMCEALKDFGYDEGIDIFFHMSIWYD